MKSEGTEMRIKKVEGRMLREVTVKIELERIDIQEGIMVETLLDSGATGLVMSSEFARKQGFKLKKLERPMNVRNVDGSLNKEGPIEHTVEVNIYFKGHRERTEIDVIGGQKWTVILGMPWLACHNTEIDWRTGEVKMTRCPEKMWEAVETRTGEIRVAKAEGGRSQGRSRKRARRKGEEEAKRKENSRNKKNSRRVGNLGQGRRGSKIRSKGQEVGSRTIP